MFGAFGLLIVIQAAIGWRWRSYYEDDGCTYRPVLGRKQYAPYASLTNVIYGKYFLYLYAGTRRFTVERGTLGIRKFDAVLQQKCGLKLIEEYNIGRVKKSGVNIFLGIVCCLAALTVTFVCIAYGKPWFVVLVTSLLGLPGYYMVWAATIWKITYDETQFTYTNIAGKTVTVPFATICKISHIGSHVLIRSSQYKHSFIIKRSADGYQPFMRYIYQLKRRKAKLISGAAGKNLQRE